MIFHLNLFLHTEPFINVSWTGISLVVQWVRLVLPMHGAGVQALVRELDPARMPQLRVRMPQLRVRMPQLRPSTAKINK